jgi:lincosamide nucleotidyltransferase A/C/D/E
VGDRLAGIEVWVDGGWGIDQLLGEQTRRHEDFDLVVTSAELGRVRAALERVRISR